MSARGLRELNQQMDQLMPRARSNDRQIPLARETPTCVTQCIESIFNSTDVPRSKAKEAKLQEILVAFYTGLRN